LLYLSKNPVAQNIDETKLSNYLSVLDCCMWKISCKICAEEGPKAKGVPKVHKC
jgi:hypothetical protein